MTVDNIPCVVQMPYVVATCLMGDPDVTSFASCLALACFVLMATMYVGESSTLALQTRFSSSMPVTQDAKSSRSAAVNQAE